MRGLVIAAALAAGLTRAESPIGLSDPLAMNPRAGSVSGGLPNSGLSVKAGLSPNPRSGSVSGGVPSYKPSGRVAHYGGANRNAPVDHPVASYGQASVSQGSYADQVEAPVAGGARGAAFKSVGPQPYLVQLRDLSTAVSGARGAPYQMQNFSMPRSLTGSEIEHPQGAARGAPYAGAVPQVRLVSAEKSTSPTGAGARGAPYAGAVPQLRLVSAEESNSSSHVAAGAHGAPYAGPHARLFSAVDHPESAAGARGAPAAGMEEFYKNVHLKEKNDDSVNVGSLQGAVVIGRSGHVAHHADGSEVDQDGSTRSANLRGADSGKFPLIDKMRSALGFGDSIPTASPTPVQPSYLHDKKNEYAPKEGGSMLTSLFNKITGRSSEPEVPPAYMDGISKPNWALGRN